MNEPQVGQVVAIEVHVMELDDRQQRGEQGRGGYSAAIGEEEDDAPWSSAIRLNDRTPPRQ